MDSSSVNNNNNNNNSNNNNNNAAYGDDISVFITSTSNLKRGLERKMQKVHLDISDKFMNAHFISLIPGGDSNLINVTTTTINSNNNSNNNNSSDGVQVEDATHLSDADKISILISHLEFQPSKVNYMVC
jgi:hypothetical protein